MLRLAALVVFIAGPIQPAIAQLDIPGYVPCYPGSGKTLVTTHPSPLTVTIEAHELRQKIHHFGASDAWSTQFVGKFLPRAVTLVRIFLQTFQRDRFQILRN